MIETFFSIIAIAALIVNASPVWNKEIDTVVENLNDLDDDINPSAKIVGNSVSNRFDNEYYDYVNNDFLDTSTEINSPITTTEYTKTQPWIKVPRNIYPGKKLELALKNVNNEFEKQLGKLKKAAVLILEAKTKILSVLPRAFRTFFHVITS